MANTIVSLFDTTDNLQNIIRDLTGLGIRRNDISVMGGDSGSADDLPGTLSGYGVPGNAAKIYEEGVRRGGTLLTARVSDDMVDPAMDVIHRYGAVDINERATQYQTGGSSGRQVGQDVSQGEYSLPVIEEQLSVGKRAVERGGVRVYSRVTETPVEETVQLREEHVTVERRPVNRAVSDADVSAFKEGTIEVTETAEEAVVAKQARVVEEVVVGKQVEERTETVRDTVRRTDVEVEQIGEDQTRTAGKGRANT